MTTERLISDINDISNVDNLGTRSVIINVYDGEVYEIDIFIVRVCEHS